MTRVSSLLIGFLTLACLGGGIVIWRMDTRITELEIAAATDDSARHSKATSARGLDRPTEEAMRTLEEKMTVLREQVDTVRGTLPSIEAAEGAVRRPVLPPSVRVAVEKHVAEAVERKLDERLAKRKDGEEGGGFEDEDDKPSVSELSKAVAMTPEQEDAAVRVLDEGKRRTFELLSTPRADGGSMAGDLVAALKGSKDPEQTLNGFFQKLMTEKIPGRSETYLTEIMKIQKATWEGLGGELEEKQMTKLRRMGLDILEVKTGYEPFEELLSGD